MCEKGYLKFFEDMQPELDKKFDVLARKEFDIYRDYFNSIKDLLDKRDKYILEKQNDDTITDFWEKTFLNCEPCCSLLPADSDNKYHAGWIKSIKIEYLEGYICIVKMELFPNEYIENDFLYKKINIEKREVEVTKVQWKSNNKCDFISFFESEEEQFEIFDYLSEVYINAYLYYSLDDVEE